MSEIGLGTQRWGSADFNAPDEALCHKMMNRAILESGVNLIDTAEQCTRCGLEARSSLAGSSRYAPAHTPHTIPPIEHAFVRRPDSLRPRTARGQHGAYHWLVAGSG